MVVHCRLVSRNKKEKGLLLLRYLGPRRGFVFCLVEISVLTADDKAEAAVCRAKQLWNLTRLVPKYGV